MGRLKNRYHEELIKHEPMTSTTDVMEEEHIRTTGMPSKELQDAGIKNLDIPLDEKPLVTHVMSYKHAKELLSNSILYNEKVSPTHLKIAWKRILVEIDNA